MILLIRIWIFIFLLPSVSTAFHIVIDPGHGGVDLGTSRDTFIEAKIVYQIAQKVKAQLEKDPEVKATLTRAETQGLSLVNRVALANRLEADLFISLHANSSDSQQVSGMEFYFSSPTPAKRISLKPGPTELVEVTSPIVEKIKSDLIQFGKMKSSLDFSKEIQQTTDQKSVIRRAPFYVIENTSMPSVLVEVGFISNRREAKKLSTPTYQAEIANLLTLAILNYKVKHQ